MSNISKDQILSVVQAAVAADHRRYVDEYDDTNKSIVTFFTILSIIRGASTLLAMWAFHLQFSFLVQVGKIEQMFQLKGKRWTMSLAMFINGLEPLIISLIPTDKLIICKSPFNFDNRWKILETIFTLPQFMMVQWLAIKAYTTPETLQHCCILHEDHINSERCQNRNKAANKMKEIARRMSVLPDPSGMSVPSIGVEFDDDGLDSDSSDNGKGAEVVSNQPNSLQPENVNPIQLMKNRKFNNDMKNLRRMSRCLELENQMEQFRPSNNSNMNNFRPISSTNYLSPGNTGVGGARNRADSKINISFDPNENEEGRRSRAVSNTLAVEQENIRRMSFGLM